MHMDRNVALRILGPVRVQNGDGWTAPSPAQLRLLIGVLAWHNGRVVPAGQLIDALWDSAPPPSARASLQSLVTRLRRLLEQVPGAAPTRSGDGYRVDLPDTAVDLGRFRALTRSARSADGPAAIGLFSAALALWDGEALADAPDTAQVRAIRQGLDREHIAAVHDRLACLLTYGRLHEAAAELPAASARYPLDEGIAAMLMETLDRSGRRVDALRAFRQLRIRLAAELGVEPGAELQRLHQRILSGDAGATAAPEHAEPARSVRPERNGHTESAVLQPSPPAPRRPPPVVPRQLPAAPAQFVGRALELRALDAMLCRANDTGDPPAVCVITGAAGVGKSALAEHWARHAAGDFPDGQLYADLEGFSRARPVPPEQAVRGFLRALGVPAAELPESLDAQSALYRSMLAGKRVLVVLDNALDTDQVRALLPGGTGCAAVVTSRQALDGLVVSVGANVVNLDVLSQAESRELIARRLGAVRAQAEPEALAELTRACGDLPLALAVAAARAAATPAVPLSAVAAELDGESRLDALESSEESSNIRQVLSWSYRQLSRPAARMFRLVGLHPGPDISVAAAAGLSGVDHLAAHHAIAELTHAHMLNEHAPGRFACHDLLHAYATEQAAACDDESERESAVLRLVDHYLHSAVAAARMLHLPCAPLELDPVQPGASPEPMHTRAAALDWFRTEHQVLLAVVDAAVAAGLEDRAWKLSAIVADYADRDGDSHGLSVVGRTAVA